MDKMKNEIKVQEKSTLQKQGRYMRNKIKKYIKDSEDLKKFVNYQLGDTDVIIISKIRIMIADGYISSDITSEQMRTILAHIHMNKEFPFKIRLSKKGMIKYR